MLVVLIVENETFSKISRRMLMDAGLPRFVSHMMVMLFFMDGGLGPIPYLTGHTGILSNIAQHIPTHPTQNSISPAST
jgi:hypothetical protein